jgi:uncharacterized membrane protein YkoI
MKKMLALGMVIIMSLAVLAGCGQKEQAPVPPEQESQANVQSQEQIPAASQPAEQGAQSQQEIIYEDGVAMNPADYDLISEDEAKQIALSKVEGASAADISRIDLDYDDRRWVYEGEIYLGEWEYEFEINAENGNIIGFEKDHIYD